LFAGYAFLADGKMLFGLSIGKGETMVPFLIGAVLLVAGTNLFRGISGTK
ncbi:MAG: hypothetical protein H7Y04_12760, partial [Verrucomicrobia bacterium]|nr:hypothetical protein [Cytophagales bacterium]